MNSQIEYNKSYWRVDAESETVEFAEQVSDSAPVGVWIPTWGMPYAYCETEAEAKEALEFVLNVKIKRLEAALESVQ